MNSNFKLIFIVIFIGAAVFGLLVFSGTIDIGGSSKTKSVTGTVSMWGTIPSQTMKGLIDDFNTANRTFTVNYIQHDAATFDQDLLLAQAEGRGPDMFLLTDDLALTYAKRIYKIPYTTYPVANYKATFAQAGEVFLNSEGVLAFPLSVDPLIMYYNRNILTTNNIVFPPSTWEDLSTITPKLLSKDTSEQITNSAVALGQYSNILHAKDILAALFMQTGNPIVGTSQGILTSFLDKNKDQYNLNGVLEFYASFSDPVKVLYSWNKSLPMDRDVFSAEKTAFYFGYASEINNLINKNPNQNLGVATLPQFKNSKFKSTKARVTGVAISAATKKLGTAYTAASLMASTNFAKSFAVALNVAPARLDLLADVPGDAYSPVFYSSALYSKSWLDPSPKDTDNIFRSMIDSVNNGYESARGAITTASGRLDLLLR